MKKLKAKGLKRLKALHLIFAALWMSGAFAVVVVLFLVKPQTHSALALKYETMLALDNWVIIAGAIATMLIGLVYGLGSNWGFFKHRWLTVKWVISISLVLFGTFVSHPTITQNWIIAQEMQDAAFADSQFLHNELFTKVAGIVQFAMLTFAMIISVYKPWKKKK